MGFFHFSRNFVFSLLIWLSVVGTAEAATVTCAGVNDTAALQNAINANDEVYILGNCMTGNLSLPGPRYIHGNVATSITFLAGYSGYMIATSANRLVLRNLSLYGQTEVQDFRYQTTAVSSRSALIIDGAQANLIENVRFGGFDKYCLHVTQITPNFGTRTTLASLYAERCFEGFRLGGEFVRHTGLTGYANRTGLSIVAGNTMGSACHFVDNGINLYIGGYPAVNNDGHGSLSACEFAHSHTPVSESDAPGFNIYAHGVQNGFVISGSQIHAGNIRLEFSKGIVISGGEIQVGWLMFIGGGCNLITDNFFFENPGAGLANNIEHNFMGYPDSTVVKNNIRATGWVPNSVGAAAACPL